MWNFFLLTLLITSAIANERSKRQLPALSCELPVLQKKIDATPVNPMTKEQTCWISARSFTQISPEDYSERRMEVFSLLRTICSDMCLPSIADLVKTCFDTYREGLSLACGSSENLQCWELPTINTGESAALSCYNTTEEGCPDDCSSNLTSLVRTGGCCINNVFNTTIFGSDLAGLQVASRELWESCNMAPISFCPTPAAFADADPTTLSTTASSATITVNIILLLMFSVMLLFL